MKGIYKFNLDGYYSALEGIFVADDSEIEAIMGEDIYFGECMGKHSEVSAVIDTSVLKLVTNEPEAVAMFEKYNLAIGTNPLHHFESQ